MWHQQLSLQQASLPPDIKGRWVWGCSRDFRSKSPHLVTVTLYSNNLGPLNRAFVLSWYQLISIPSLTLCIFWTAYLLLCPPSVYLPMAHYGHHKFHLLHGILWASALIKEKTSTSFSCIPSTKRSWSVSSLIYSKPSDSSPISPCHRSSGFTLFLLVYEIEILPVTVQREGV